MITTYINYIAVAANSDAACKSQTAVHAKQATPNNYYAINVRASLISAHSPPPPSPSSPPATSSLRTWGSPQATTITTEYVLYTCAKAVTDTRAQLLFSDGRSRMS